MEDTRKTNRAVTAEQKIKIIRDVMATPEFAKMAKEIEAMTPVERTKLSKSVECRKMRTRVRIADCPEPDIYIEPSVVFFVEEVVVVVVYVAVLAIMWFTIGPTIDDPLDDTDEEIQDAGVPPAGGVPDAGVPPA